MPWAIPAAIVGGSVISGVMGGEAADVGAGAAEAATAEERRQFDLTWGANAPFRQAGVNALGQMAMLTGGADPRVEAFNDRKTEIIQNYRQSMTGSHSGDVLRVVAGQMGADSFSDVSDEQIEEYLLSSNLTGDMFRDYSGSASELRSLNQDLQAFEAAPGQTVEEMVKADPSYQFRFKEGMDATQNMLSAQNRRLGGSALKGITDYGQDFASQEYGNIFNRQATIAGYGPQANITPANQISQGIIAGGQADASRYSAYNQAIQGGIQNYLTYDASQQSPNVFSGGGAPIPAGGISPSEFITNPRYG